MRRCALFLALVLLAGCGGGGGASHAVTPAVAPSSAPAGMGNIQFTIDVPAMTAARAKKRGAAYVSPATKSVSVTIGGSQTIINVGSGAVGCTTYYGQPSITETNVNSQPRGMVLGPDGNVWFVEDGGETVGNIAPGGVYTDYFFGYFENGIIVGPDGALWTTSPYNSLLGHITTGGTVTTFGGFPEDMQYLAKAADNTVWGTSYTNGPSNVLYHVAANGSFLAGDTITTTAATQMPALGPDGAIYVTENNGSNGWIARIAESLGVWSLTNEFPLPGIPYAITNGPDNALWITENTGHVYRMTTAGTITKTFSLSTPGVGAAIHTLPDGALWIAEYDANKIARLTTGGILNEFTIPHPATAPYDVVAGSDGIYFSEQNANIIGRANFPVECGGGGTAPLGTSTAVIRAYDGASGSGQVLSLQTVSVTVSQNTANNLNFTLNPVVKSIVIGTGNANAGCVPSGSVPLIVEAMDPDGNAIIGPGNYSDAAGNPLTINLTTNDASGNSTFTNGVLTGPGQGTPSLNWSGGAVNPQNVGAVVSGGSITGTITPAFVSNSC